MELVSYTRALKPQSLPQPIVLVSTPTQILLKQMSGIIEYLLILMER